MSKPVLSIRGLERSYVTGAGPLPGRRGADSAGKPGARGGCVWPAGSGNSSLLHAAGLLERPNAGRITVLSRDCSDLPDRDRTRVRLGTIGFVYQFHHLLPEFTALDNVALPLMIAGKSQRAARTRAGVLLGELGLSARLHHQPAQMSGGEQQRVAVARALANSPRLLLADEPTGNLDPATSGAVFENLYALARKTGVAALIATHNLDLARHMDRVFALKDGHLEEQPKTVPARSAGN